MLKLRTENLKPKTANRKAQSMLEYLVLFISVVAAGLIGTNAFMGPAMRNGLATMQNTAANNLINNPNPPASVTSQSYYTPTRNETSPTGENNWQTPHYAGSQGGAPFEANRYYFREGASDMNYAPRPGQVLDSYTEWKAPPVHQLDIPSGNYPYYYDYPQLVNNSNFYQYYYPNYQRPDYYGYYEQ